MQQKQCTECGIHKPISMFHAQKLGKFGVNSKCKNCISIKKIARYHSDRDKYRKAATASYHKNRDATLERQRIWREANRDICRKLSSIWRLNNKGLVAEKSKEYREKNKEALALHNAKYHQEHKEEIRNRKRKWRINNLASIKERKAFRHRRIKQNIKLSAENKSKVKEIYALRNDLNLAARSCGAEAEFQVDHIMPICGDGFIGLHAPWNMQILTRSENVRKGNRIYATKETED